MEKTKEQIVKHYLKQARQWSAERRLSRESQLKGLVSNLLEETLEYTRAQNQGERIDALCDICIFCFNAISDYSSQRDLVSKHAGLHHLIKSIGNIQLCLKLMKSEKPHKSSAIFNLDVELLNIISNAITMIDKAGYDTFKALGETFREIESRTGKYDERIGKWVKDTSEQAKAKWYKADYTKARK